MKERRSLVEGLKSTPEVQEREESFVFGPKKRMEALAANAESESVPVPVAQPIVTEPAKVEQQPKVLPQMTGRVPITTRARPEVATALKRASLQRQLAGSEPYHVQDIVEEALENWLSAKGYV